MAYESQLTQSQEAIGHSPLYFSTDLSHLPKHVHFEESSQSQEEEVSIVRQPVESSNIASIGYDPISSTLEVQFNKGDTYQYSDVPFVKYKALMAAQSKGSYLASSIKPHHKATKL